MSSSPVPGFSTLDLVRLLFGVLIAAAGLVACLLFAQRRNSATVWYGTLQHGAETPPENSTMTSRWS